MFELEHPKWVLNGDRLVMGRVILHRDLLKDNSETHGGGWWHYDSENKIMYLYGKSEEFGIASEEDVKLAWEDTTHAVRGIQLVFSHETSLAKVLHPELNSRVSIEDKEGNRYELGFAHVHVPLLVDIPTDHHIGVDYAHRKDEPVVVFAGGGKSKPHFLSNMLFGSLSYGDLLTSPELTDIEKEARYLQAIEVPIQRREEFASIGLGEKKKKKPCTSHEYVQDLKEDGAGSRLYRSSWKCRHCNHPLK